ncbi:P22 tail accessory factor [compost metagenome]
MSFTKRQFVEQAFSEIGLAGYIFDLSPEQLQNALRQLDSMMAGWNARGIRVGYPLPGSPNDSDLDQETNVPDAANEAIYLNLGIRIGPTFGKTLMPELKANAKMAYDTVLLQAALPMERQFPRTLPAGSGNKPWRVYDDPFLRGPFDPILTGQDGPLDLN